MTTRVKICGVTNLEDALRAAELGADAIGLIQCESERRVDAAKAREIAQALPPYVDRVGVFRDASRAEVEERARACGLTRAQLHGDEAPEDFADLLLPVTKTLSARPDEARACAEAWRRARPHTDFLLDVPKDDSAPDLEDWWRELGELVTELGATLAGGLDPDNVVVALERLAPAAVDVARGVESRPGHKDHDRMQAFLSAVRRHDALGNHR